MTTWTRAHCDNPRPHKPHAWGPLIATGNWCSGDECHGGCGGCWACEKRAESTNSATTDHGDAETPDRPARWRCAWTPNGIDHPAHVDHHTETEAEQAALVIGRRHGVAVSIYELEETK